MHKALTAICLVRCLDSNDAYNGTERIWNVGLKKLLLPGEEVPELFDDPVFQRSSHWVLSTSAIFSKHFSVYGWGEVRSTLFISISSYKYWPERSSLMALVLPT